MLLCTVLIVIAVQRFLHVPSHAYRLHFAPHYYEWCARKIEYVTKGHGLLGLAILIAPVLLAVSIIFSMVLHSVGWPGYILLNVLLLWYCIDARDWLKQSTTTQGPIALLQYAYPVLFGVLFWFALFGPIGLVLYYLVHYFKDYLQSRSDAESRSLEHFSKQVAAVLDWVPLRLFTFSFALVGHFSAVFKEWMRCLASGLDPDYRMIADCATPIVSSTDDAVHLSDRCLLVWLIVIALMTAGTWLH